MCASVMPGGARARARAAGARRPRADGTTERMHLPSLILRWGRVGM